MRRLSLLALCATLPLALGCYPPNPDPKTTSQTCWSRTLGDLAQAGPPTAEALSFAYNACAELSGWETPSQVARRLATPPPQRAATTINPPAAPVTPAK